MRVRPPAKRARPPFCLVELRVSAEGSVPTHRPGRTTLHVAVPSHPKVVRFAGHGVCS
jgi:hypothetical protein